MLHNGYNVVSNIQQYIRYLDAAAFSWTTRCCYNASMQTAPIPENEGERIESLKRLQILDTPPEERFDLLTKLADALGCGMEDLHVENKTSMGDSPHSAKSRRSRSHR